VATVVNRRTVHIEWGDCDAAGIVFYPRYFAMFDASTMALFESVGWPQKKLMQAFNFRGWPMVDTRARFILPSSYGDDIVIETTVAAFRRSSFDVSHKVWRGADLAIEGWETRVWTGPHPDDPDRLKSTPMPASIIIALGGTPGPDAP
jgi:4-hydroxybenzoyl-CoA thioesterase